MKVDGRIVRKTLLQLVIENDQGSCHRVPSMVALFDEIHAKVSPTQDKLEGGFLLPGSTVAGRVHRER